MKGIYHLGRPTPKYPMTWNAEDFLSFLKNRTLHNDSSLKDVTLK